jgi:hypothetical protein
MNKYYLLLTSLILLSCSADDTKLFSKLSAFKTDITFENKLEETMDLNVFTYDYVYNGSGVAIGDVNNDGLSDIYFCGNMVPNKLYLNQGGFDFNDVTDEALVKGKDGWKTGVTMADVNGDGKLDIYVCYSGLKENDRSNQLFINNGSDKGGIPSFTEKAKEFGLDAPGTYSTQSYFFDYDLDGDLDMFLLNHGVDYHSSSSNALQGKGQRHPEFGSRLYRNDKNIFTDVSAVTGLEGGWLDYGLSVSIADFNNDNFPDFYVSNDFDERDFFYINHGDGTFKESLKDCFGHISKFTMGTDAADFNNDNYPDLVTLDMLPEDNYRQKLLKGPDGFDKYNYFVKQGFYFQQMRNMLHLNRGLKDGNLPVFSEIGQLSGISNTDWSWSSLFADFDNDGNKDLFISNGYLRDFTNLDFQKYDFENARREIVYSGKSLNTEGGKKFMFEFINKMNSIKVSNYIYKNSGDLRFEDKTKDWGLSEQTLTNGAAYADLDNDGDLDLVVNNLNEKAGIFRNNSEKFNNNHFLTVKLTGDKQNKFGIGSKVYIKTPTSQQFLEANYGRGYLSSVDYALHFGLGKETLINEVKVVWPDGKFSTLQNVKADATLEINYTSAVSKANEQVKPKPLLSDVTEGVAISFVHQENNFIDYKQERLLLYKLSTQGPKMSVGDVNRDGLEDIFIGGAKDQAGVLFLQMKNEKFQRATSQPWELDKTCEDVASQFFDCDNDGDLDLYIVSGGNEFAYDSKEYQDRLYINDGRGNFFKAIEAIPNRTGSGSCIAAADFDQDGDLDLFVGAWTLPGSYPKCSPSRILKNESKKNKPLFIDVTEQLNPALKETGVLHDAKWSDYDNDGLVDLIIAGDWMPIRVFKNEKTKFTDVTEKLSLNKTNGFWSTLSPVDIDGDGDVDYIAGNLGLNSELKASVDQPLKMYVADFDRDNKMDPIICSYIQGVSCPLATRDELQSQILPMRKKFIRYSQYADATIEKILDSTQLKNADLKEIYTLQSSVLENVGNGKFKIRPLPQEVQFAPVESIVVKDFDGDKINDLLVTGNFYSYRAEYGPFDASIGLILIGDGKGNFTPMDRSKSGVLIQGDVRDVAMIKTPTRDLFVVSKNNGPVQILSKPSR